jgi:hypothetical protein
LPRGEIPWAVEAAKLDRTATLIRLAYGARQHFQRALHGQPCLLMPRVRPARLKSIVTCSDNSRVVRTPLLYLTLVLLAQAAPPDAKWLALIGGSGADLANGIAVDHAGNVYTTGYIEGTNVMFGAHVVTNSGGRLMYVTKFDRFGSNVWVTTTSGNGTAEGRGVAVDQNGNVYVAGTFSGSPATFGTSKLTPNTSDMFLARLDSDGQFQWARQAHDPHGWIQLAGALTIAGTNIYVAGQCTTGMDFSSAALTNTAIFLAIYDFDGNVVAARSLANAPIVNGFARQVAVNSDGSYYTGLIFESETISFGGTNLGRAGQYADTVFTKWDATGNLLWFRHLKGGAYGQCLGITLAPNSDVVVAGRTGGAGSFAEQPVEDAFLARLTSDGDLLWLNNLATNAAFINGVATDLGGNTFICGGLPPGISAIGGRSITNNSMGVAPLAARFDSAGHLDWTLCGIPTEGAHYGEARSVAVDSSGAVYLSGFVDSSMRLGSRSAARHGSWDILLARLAPDSPVLRIQSASDAVILSWPTNQLGFAVECTGEFDGAWAPAIGPVARQGANFISTLMMTNSVGFFRLREE